MFSGLMSRCTTPCSVGVVERSRHLARRSERRPRPGAGARAEPVAQALALDERHRVPELPGRLARVVHRQDVRVLEPGGVLDLAQEALGPERVRQLRMQHLERHRSVVLQVVAR